jgi:hypothetical protein
MSELDCKDGVLGAEPRIAGLEFSVDEKILWPLYSLLSPGSPLNRQVTRRAGDILGKNMWRALTEAHQPMRMLLRSSEN